MNRKIVLNIAANTFLAVIFVLLNIWAVNMGLEETFVALAVLYGIATIISNAFFITLIWPKKRK
jgi:hypothetical protein